MVVNLHDEVRANKRKSIFVIMSFFLFVIVLGFVAGLVFLGVSGGVFSVYSGLVGAVFAFVLSLIYMMIFMSTGDKMILSVTGATLASRSEYPYLYHTTEALSLAAGLKTPPKCYIIKDNALNAYATGFTPEKSYIVVTTGLIDKLNREELEGVLAHEMSHIKNSDIKVMLIAAGLVGVTVLISDMLFRMFIFAPRSGGGRDNDSNDKLKIVFILVGVLLVILSPIIAQLIKLAISRKREYLADSTGALLTRYPEGLASALEKIKNSHIPLQNANKATAHLFISNPLKDGKQFLSSMFSTHPPIEDRIKRLRGIKG